MAVHLELPARSALARFFSPAPSVWVWMMLLSAELRPISFYMLLVCMHTDAPFQLTSPNQSVLKETNSEYSLKGLNLKLQYFGHVIQRADSLEKTLMLGKIEGKRRRGQQRMRWLDSITNSMDTS